MHLSSQLSGISTLHFSILLTAGSDCSLMAAGLQVLFSFLVALRTQKFTFGGLKSLMTVTSLFMDMAGNTLCLIVCTEDKHGPRLRSASGRTCKGDSRERLSDVGSHKTNSA